MTVRVDFQPVCLSAREGGEDACLVLVDGVLSAILVRLIEDSLPSEKQRWYLETSFPPYDTEGLIFPCLETAESWIRERLSSDPNLCSS